MIVFIQKARGAPKKKGLLCIHLFRMTLYKGAFPRIHILVIKK